MDTTPTSTTPETDKQPSTPAAIGGLGATWARYGLRVGAFALESQSRRLEALGQALAHTAQTLAEMANRLTEAPTKSPSAEATPATDSSAPNELESEPSHH